MKKDGVKMRATMMRNFLAFLMVVIVLGATAGFYFGLQLVKAYALDVSHTVSDASASSKSVDQLSVLKQQLAEKDTLITKANELFATQNNYQSQSLKDIQKYASEVGITVTNIEFDKSTSTTPDTGSTAGHSIVVTLQSPVSYSKFIRFLDAIEGNLPKMQITGISAKRPATASGDQIAAEKLTITVATR